jgi:hypothetical protein
MNRLDFFLIHPIFESLTPPKEKIISNSAPSSSLEELYSLNHASLRPLLYLQRKLRGSSTPLLNTPKHHNVYPVR